MNNYYLIAFDKEPKIIEITLDMNGEETKVTSTTIQNIDRITSIYNMDQIKKHLLNKGKISSMDVELLVVHQSKYKGNTHIKTFPVLTNNDYLKPYKTVKVDDVAKLIITFFNKMKKPDFEEVAKYYYNDLNPHALKDFQRIYATIFNNSSVREEYVEYKDVRSLVSIIIDYDRFKNIREYQDYFFNVNRYINDHFDELVRMTNANIPQGQMSFSFENGNVVYHDMNEVIRELDIEDEENLDYYELYFKIQDEPFDNPEVKKWFETNMFPKDANKRMTLNDKVRTGFITPFEYQDIMYKRSEKRK